MDEASATQLSLWSTFSADQDEGEDGATAPPQSVALNFFIACLAQDLKFVYPGHVVFDGEKTRVAGTGGYGTVEVGNQIMDKHTKGKLVKMNRLVAVKKAKAISQPIWDDKDKAKFNAYMDQLTLELRILSHDKLLRHPNIVDILGLYLDDFQNTPTFAIVLEYSKHGSLRSFLKDKQDGMSVSNHINAIAQVSRGIKALHDLQICHGDVKTQNTLVFWDETKDSWSVKISDFGQSLIAPGNDPTAQVQLPLGTRLLNAPEVRKGYILDEKPFTIQSAMLTDLYSLALLAWEVLQNGRDYFQQSWFGANAGTIDTDLKEDFLDKLPVNGLLNYGLEFLESLQLSREPHTQLRELMENCLQDIPECRKPIPDAFLASGCSTPNSTTSLGDVFKRLGLEDLLETGFSLWSTKHSLFDVQLYAIWRGRDIFDDINPQIREQIVSELKAFADSPALEPETRAHSALTVAECVSIGFIDTVGDDQVLEWLHKAAFLGQHKARMWYHRICEALSHSPKNDIPPLESCDDLFHATPPEYYLIKRIHSLSEAVVRRVNVPENPHYQRNPKSLDLTFNVILFDGAGQDHISAIHVAAWLGDDDALQKLLVVEDPNETTTLGLNAAHYACLGGHLSTLRILMKSGTEVVPAAGFHNVSPLHFAVFFQSSDLPEAINLLIENGATPDSYSEGEIYWGAHDLRFSGAVILWAISARYRELLKILLSYCTSISQHVLYNAMSRFYWDLLEILLPKYKPEPDEASHLTRLTTVSYPFCFWLAHGRDGLDAIKRTVQLWGENGLIGFNDNGSSHLASIVSAARTTADLQLVQSIIDVSSDDYVRHQGTMSPIDSAMSEALTHSGDSKGWQQVIRSLVDRYPLAELQWKDGNVVHNFIWQAISFGSEAGVRVLLEKGVDINAVASNGQHLRPLHYCFHNWASSEMISLLLDFGADVLQRDHMLGLMPVEWAVYGYVSRAVFDTLLKTQYDDAVYMSVLELARRRTATGPNEVPGDRRLGPIFDKEGLDDTRDTVVHKQHSLSLLRYLLSKDCFSRQVNNRDEAGTTLIQRAAYQLHLDSVRVLLDAQADATIKFESKGHGVLPLQIACTIGRTATRVDSPYPLHVGKTQAERQSEALAVAREILSWHIANGDDAFEGITELHLACRMAIEHEIERLLEAGHDTQAQGTWPGLPGKVTPKDLLERLEEEEDFIINEFPLPKNPPERFHGQESDLSPDLDHIPEEFRDRVANASPSEYSDIIDEILNSLSVGSVSGDSDV
ncbi:hypothetical protein F4861DRAFT_231471 [Xylaria intraflava]|nr:hypothetical protein F4861DRAFT_231471 [Xylaria intraflava]